MTITPPATSDEHEDEHRRPGCASSSPAPRRSSGSLRGVEVHVGHDAFRVRSSTCRRRGPVSRVLRPRADGTRQTNPPITANVSDVAAEDEAGVVEQSDHPPAPASARRAASATSSPRSSSRSSIAIARVRWRTQPDVEQRERDDADEQAEQHQAVHVDVAVGVEHRRLLVQAAPQPTRSSGRAGSAGRPAGRSPPTAWPAAGGCRRAGARRGSRCR